MSEFSPLFLRHRQVLPEFDQEAEEGAGRAQAFVAHSAAEAAAAAAETLARVRHLRRLRQRHRQQGALSRRSHTIRVNRFDCGFQQGNKIQADRFDGPDKKQGLRLHEKQRVSPWDIIEGQKTPAPLSWAWFGAVRMERKPLRYQVRLKPIFIGDNKFQSPT